MGYTETLYHLCSNSVNLQLFKLKKKNSISKEKANEERGWRGNHIDRSVARVRQGLTGISWEITPPKKKVSRQEINR